jgi:hypothetical protein
MLAAWLFALKTKKIMRNPNTTSPSVARAMGVGIADQRKQ